MGVAGAGLVTDETVPLSGCAFNRLRTTRPCSTSKLAAVEGTVYVMPAVNVGLAMLKRDVRAAPTVGGFMSHEVSVWEGVISVGGVFVAYPVEAADAESPEVLESTHRCSCRK